MTPEERHDYYINVERYKLDIWGPSVQADYILTPSTLEAGIPAFKLFHLIGLTETKSEARRLIKQGGAYCNSERIESFDMPITSDHIINNEIILKVGKKKIKRVVVK